MLHSRLGERTEVIHFWKRLWKKPEKKEPSEQLNKQTLSQQMTCYNRMSITINCSFYVERC